MAKIKSVKQQLAGDRRRVVIERIAPMIDGGLFPIKRIQGERIDLEVDLFTDGHDQIAAVLQYRKAGASAWSEIPLLPWENDRWRASFTVDLVGNYTYTVTAWVDHLLTWFRDLKKRLDAHQVAHVDLLIGAEMIEGAAKRAKGEDAQLLKQWCAQLKDPSLSPSDRAALACQENFRLLAQKYPDRSRATTFAPELPLWVDRERAGFSAWYEFFPRSWSKEPGKHGTFKDCERILPEISKMGFDVIYLPPIHPIGVTKRKGKNNTLVALPDDVGSPWAIGSAEGGHKALHPQLGTLTDFKKFIKAANKRGIEIAMDIAFQCSPDHPYVLQHPEWFKWRPDGTVQFAENPPKKYEDILPINFETEKAEELWIELKSIFEYWIEQGVEIFRVDNPHTKSFEFWRWLITSIREKNPNIIFLAEAFTRPKLMYRLAKAGYTHSYTYFSWRNTKQELTEYLTELTQGEGKEFFRPNFWPNTPDILPPLLQTGLRSAFMSRLVLAATLSSNYGVYGPAYELCLHEPYPGKEEYVHSEKYELKAWNWDHPGNLKELMTQLNQIRKDNRALHSTNNLRFQKIDNSEILAHLKATEENTNIILTLVNLDPRHTQSGWLSVPWHEFGIDPARPFWVHDLLTDEKYHWQGERSYVVLRPESPAHLFRVIKN